MTARDRVTRLTAATAEETEEFGRKLAGGRPPSDALAIVYLTGDLGAGKTTLARGFLRECGVQGVVRSPTYTLVETYPVGATTYVHLDLYRLIDPAELENLGLRDWATGGHVWLVEWPERGIGRLPPADLVVKLAGTDSGHVIEVEGTSVMGREWLARVE